MVEVKRIQPGVSGIKFNPVRGRPLPPRDCDQCRQPYVPTNKNQKYCEDCKVLRDKGGFTGRNNWGGGV